MMMRPFVALCSVTSVASSGVFRRAASLSADVAPLAPLPPSDTAALRKIEQGVKSLEVPHQAQQAPAANSTQQAAKASGCSFLGGLVFAEVSKQCCTNVRVVSQRQLDQYGMAENCDADWHCSTDGKTPVPAFETQALSSMCGEPGCLPAVVEAMKSNTMTEGGAKEMGGICATLSSMGGSKASPEKVSHMLTGAGARVGKGGREGAARTSGKKCIEENCPSPEKKAEFCKKLKEEQSCYKECCKKDDKGAACFPGEAVAYVEDKGQVPLARLTAGERVLVESEGQLTYEPVLSFLHAIRKRSGESMPFVTVIHTHGMFRASPAHIVFVTSDAEKQGSRSALVANLRVGDQVFSAVQRKLVRSRILAIQQSSTRQGMYAPLTASGTIVVDGVVASNYASPSESKHLPHTLAHAVLWPVRLYHYFSLGSRLQPLWQHLCQARIKTEMRWFCQGGGLMLKGSEEEDEEMHPYLRLLWKGLRLDVFLQAS